MTRRGRFVPIGLLLVVAVCARSAAAQEADVRARDVYARALEMEARGNDGAALPLLWEAAGLAPDDPDVQNRLGEALARLGALDAAVDTYRRALSARPDFQKAADNVVLALVQSGRGAEAVSEARAFIARSPGNPDRWFTLGLAQAEQDVEEAMRTFARVLAVAPRHTLARYNLALVLQRADRLSDAAEELGRALAIEPRPEAYYTLGVIRWHQGDLDAALTALRAAVAADPRYASAHYTLGAVLKERRDWAGAAEALRRAIALRPDQPGAYVTLARVLQLLGDERGARTQFEEGERLRLQAQRTQEALVWTAVGTEKLDAGNLAGALDALRRATAVFEGYAPAHYQMGRALARLGEPEAARAAFVRAQQLNPSLLPPGFRD
jgi:tetratricopeptide (TPR) repeat protein